jgi:beta-lactamase regulating signal transducer with metallopeptidase domain
MSALVETFVAALALSALAGACLALLPNAPPRVRFGVALAGLGAWLVPWAWIRVPLAAQPSTLDVTLRASLERIAELGGTISQGTAPAVPAAVGNVSAAVLAALFLVGAAQFAGDCVALRRCVRRWRAASRPGDELRNLLPPELRHVAAEIRVVRGSRVAAASGWLKPTVWIGDRHTGAALKLILVHETWHVRQRDPLAIAVIAAVRRIYWWNPLVAHLAREAVLMLESACDHRSAAHFGKSSYIAELAALMLGDASPAPRLLATARSASANVARLELLGADLRLRARDAALIAALTAAGAVTAAASVVERAVHVELAARSAVPAGATMVGPLPDSLPSGLPGTPAGRALATMLRAANAGDDELLREILNAYTPQEMPLPFPSGGDVRVVDVLRSEPLRIEYVVEARDGGARGIGEIEVAGAAPQRITSSRLRELP